MAAQRAPGQQQQLTGVDIPGSAVYIAYYTADWQRPGTAFYPEGASGDSTASSASASLLQWRGWRAERLILNPVPSDVLKMQGSLVAKLARQPELNSITPVKVAVYNAYWPSRWWEKYATRTGRNFLLVTPSDSRCLVRSEFPGVKALASVNASRPVYTDDPKCVEKWEKLYQSGGIAAVRKAVVEALQSFFP
ncbi:hypothetical protein OEZ86_005498 [Tetradesmus obliquus]|nr:hypothetical protein OEZ86_005498 [Tetradesmus obliquus]